MSDEAFVQLFLRDPEFARVVGLHLQRQERWARMSAKIVERCKKTNKR